MPPIAVAISALKVLKSQNLLARDLDFAFIILLAEEKKLLV
jgi:hypothetical protein